MTKIPTLEETYLAAHQLAAMFGVNKATIWRWSRDKDDFPAPIKLGGKCSRWKASAIRDWAASKEDAA